MAFIGPQLGCTDPLATNYSAAATIDDGSCIYPPTIITPTYNEGLTLSFSEVAKGWTSFKSFVQDGGLSLNNDYYTFKNTNTHDATGLIISSDFLIWKHHVKVADLVTGLETNRNNFYGQQSDSHVDVLFNEESATVKSFASMKYEGSQSRITANLTDPAYFNNEVKKGWYVESGNTDLQLAGEMEFKDKEGKWFSYMKGVPVKTVADLNSKEFSFQGIDLLDSIVDYGNGRGVDILGCMDPLASNYNANATIDDGSCTGGGQTNVRWRCGLGNICVPCNQFCQDNNPTWVTYATQSGCQSNCPGSGISGCTDPIATNYDPLATIDDGSCVYPAPIYGCTDATANNYNPNATIDDGSCTYDIYGCTDPTANNYYAGATVDDGSCTYDVYGCTDPTAVNYNSLATVDDQSCICAWPHGGLSGGGPVLFQPIYTNLTPGSPPGGGVNVYISLTQPDGPYDIELEDPNGNLYANTFGTTTHTTNLGFAGTVSYDNMPAGQYVARATDINGCTVWMGIVMN